MKSQVNVLLQVSGGILKDASLTYPELKESFLKDYERIALYSRTRGLGLFTQDLPSLETALLGGLEDGRLSLSGALSTRVSKRIRVPRLYAGLWLRVFEKDSSLKLDVDITALFFLRQLLKLGKKLEVDCSPKRRKATVEDYYDIERKLRAPTLGWENDSLFPEPTAGDRVGSNRRGHAADDQYCCHSSSDRDCDDLFHGDVVHTTEPEEDLITVSFSEEGPDPLPVNVHLAQALDRSLGTVDTTLPLYSSQGKKRHEKDYEAQRSDLDLLNKAQQVADLIVSSFDVLEPVALSGQLESECQGTGFKHGPGAVAERKKFWEKSQFSNWPRKLQTTFPFELCGTTAGFTGDRPQNHEVASRLLAVPKTVKSPRLIAAEPVAHQWCQQLVLNFFFSQCRKTFRGSSFIDFRDQSLSADLVIQASRDRSLSTVDLSEASDRLSCWTVERIFRSSRSILTALHAARTRYLQDGVNESHSVNMGFLKLKKFASQGTAVTFPVMSLTMLCLALASSVEGDITWKNIWKYRDQVRVFGDDIILPTHGYERLLRVMELCQLKVNVAKSYTTGYFRESCGADGYKGHDVTPVCPKVIVATDATSQQALLDYTNNLFNKGLWHASDALFSHLPPLLQRGLRVVAKSDVAIRGLTSYCGSDESHLRTRWNSRLHRYEVKVWFLSDRPVERPRDDFSALLDFFTSKHSHEQARTVSRYAESRKTKHGLRWEPSSPDAGLPHLPPRVEG